MVTSLRETSDSGLPGLEITPGGGSSAGVNVENGAKDVGVAELAMAVLLYSKSTFRNSSYRVLE
jgi:hypothetical protein